MRTHGSRWAFGLALALVATTGGLWARDLTFEDRVKAQEAIERVYWNHRIWPKENPGPKPPLSAVMSDKAIRAKVEGYLRKSNALEQFWHRRITAGQLEAEIARMARETRNPRMLTELFASLNDDPILVAECLARPLLAERLVRNLYVRDDALHRNSTRRQGGAGAVPIYEHEGAGAARRPILGDKVRPFGLAVDPASRG